MENKHGQRSWALHRLLLLCGLAAGLALIVGGGHSLARTQDVAAERQATHGIAQKDAYRTTVAYVTTFYPLWFTYYQSQFGNTNRLVGPERISPLYQIVVAINNDTLYASTFLNLTDQPMILKIPPTTVTYSILTLDPYGNIFETGLTPTASGGTYVLYGPGFTRPSLTGVTPIDIPLNYGILIFRADKFSSTGEDETAAAEGFREGLFTQPLCAYLNQTCPTGIPPGGAALILPEIAFAVPFKTAADTLIARDPIRFLRQLQTAVAAPNTPPMSPAEQELSAHFDRLFGDSNTKKSELSAGAQAAHALILERYLTHTGPTNWIHFTNIGAWGDNVIDRAAITEFLQFGNGINTAAYFHAFRDSKGVALDGNRRKGYILTFPKDQLPEAKRFWSITAYTPNSIELIDNPANKYHVASYTPGLEYNADGSLSIYIARELPAGVPMANWLPVSRRRFNIMLRIYGPEDSITTYIPPAIERNH